MYIQTRNHLVLRYTFCKSISTFVIPLRLFLHKYAFKVKKKFRMLNEKSLEKKKNKKKKKYFVCALNTFIQPVKDNTHFNTSSFHSTDITAQSC